MQQKTRDLRKQKTQATAAALSILSEFVKAADRDLSAREPVSKGFERYDPPSKLHVREVLDRSRDVLLTLKRLRDV
jgi:hypothetical protein